MNPKAAPPTRTATAVKAVEHMFRGQSFTLGVLTGIILSVVTQLLT